MKEVPSNYDEETQLTKYVWDHFPHLRSQFEHRVALAIFAKEKEAFGHEAVAKLMEKRHSLANDSEVQLALSEGMEAFRRRVCQRIIREYSGDIFINRCPSCMRIVRTPEAKQCFWCGFDWHPALS